MLEVRLIGSFDIQSDDKPVILSSRAAQSLFAYLILTAGTLHRREKLAGMLWPDESEQKARTFLRNELWRIRKALSQTSSVEYLLADNLTVGFNQSSPYWLDTAGLKDLSDKGSADELIQSLSNYQGELLPGFYEDWVVLEREHLQVLFEQKIACLLEMLGKEQRWTDVLEWAERWISFGQAPEAAYRALMVAYDALGDHSKVAATYERCKQALRQLDLEPSEQTRGLAFKRSSKLKVPIPLTSFIGREKELKEVTGLFSKSRLITLTGSGGVGKTRLAIQVVAEVLDLFPDGVWFLDLAPLTDPALVPQLVLTTLGLIEQAGRSPVAILTDFLQTRRALFFLDNCEHLIQACSQLAETLLLACPTLHILTTSREALRVAGEIPYRVPSLEIPGPDIESDIDSLAKVEAVQLFTERAAVVSPGFAVGLQNVLIVAQICRRLDGIPLAVELAAARSNMLSVQQILKRLDGHFDFLTGGIRTAPSRHQTLRATIEWSYGLLSEAEALLFRRLAVFMGGWSLEAAEEVCSGNGIESSNVLELLSQLVNKSLVMVETVDVESRYHRLETIHQFAREKLFETTEAARLRDKHLTYFLKRAEEIEPYLTGAEQSAWMDYLDFELENIRLALDWSISSKRGEESLRLCGALGWFWFIRCHIREGGEWSRRGLELRDGTSDRAQALALRSAGWMHFAKDDFSTSTALHYESLDFYRKLEDMKEISTALQFLGIVENVQGNLSKARTLFEESLVISRSIDNKQSMPRVLIHLGQFAQTDGDHLTAWRYYEEALAICRDIKERHLTTVVLGTMGYFAFSQKNNQQARKYYQEALEICLTLKNKRSIAELLLNFAEILSTESQYPQSARLHGFAETLFNESESLTESHLAEIKRIAEAPKMHLGEDSYRREFDIGKTLKLEQVVEITLK